MSTRQHRKRYAIYALSRFNYQIVGKTRWQSTSATAVEQQNVVAFRTGDYYQSGPRRSPQFS